MTEDEYLLNLKTELESRRSEGLSETEIQRVLAGAADRFERALSQGRSLIAVIESMGEASHLAEGALARAILHNKDIKRGPSLIENQKLIRALKALFKIAPVNFLIAASPVVLTLGMIVILIAVDLVFLGCVFSSCIEFVFKAMGDVSFGVKSAIFTFLLGLVSFGFLVLFSTFVLTRFFLRWSWRWVQVNVDFLMKETEA